MPLRGEFTCVGWQVTLCDAVCLAGAKVGCVVIKQVSDLYIAKISEESQCALGMGARGQGRLTESSEFLNDV